MEWGGPCDEEESWYIFYGDEGPQGGLPRETRPWQHMTAPPYYHHHLRKMHVLLLVKSIGEVSQNDEWYR